jgi:hypothetical protein
MKKTYICPKTNVVKIKHQHKLLAGSFDGALNTTGAHGNEALSREFDDDDIDF